MQWEYCALMALGRSGTSLEEKLAGKLYHEMGKAIARRNVFQN